MLESPVMRYSATSVEGNERRQAKSSEPSAKTSFGPTTPAAGRSSKPCAKPAIPFDGTIVSGLRISTASGGSGVSRIRRNARLLPAEKPSLRGDAIK